MSAGAALFGALMVFGFSFAVLVAGLALLSDYLGQHPPGSGAEDAADWRAIRLAWKLAMGLALVFLLSVWWRHR